MRILKEKPLKVFGGEQVRDFTYIDDIAEATILSAEKDSTTGKFFNVGTGRPTSINELAKLMIDISNTEVPIEYEERPEGDPLGGYADTSRTEELLDWKPEGDLKKGIEKYWNWIKSNESYIQEWI